MLKRHIAFYGEAPRQAAADGGYASRDNLAQAKALGVHDMAFHKKAGLRIKDMVKSNWVYRKLRNFRAGIEYDISCLKRAFGLARCVWRGLDHFRAYVWSSVVAYNLALFARASSRPDFSPSPVGLYRDWPSPGRTLIPLFRKYTAGSAHATATANEMAPKHPVHRPTRSIPGQKIMRLWTDTKSNHHRRSPTMRQERTVQASIFDLFADHDIGGEPNGMSQSPVKNGKLIGLAQEDLRRHGVKETGREGLPAELVLRCALLKQHRQLSYEESRRFILKTLPRSGPSLGCRCR